MKVGNYSNYLITKIIGLSSRVIMGGVFFTGTPAWSGRRDSNPRHPAWKAGTLPLSYSRSHTNYPPISNLNPEDLSEFL